MNCNTVNQQKKSSQETKFQTKNIGVIIFIVGILALLLVGTISASTWDDIKSYDKDLRQYTLTNALGFGGEISKVKMNTPHINNIGIGYQQVAEMNVKNGGWDYSQIIKQIQTYNLKNNNQEINRKIDIKYKVVTKTEIPIYEKCDKNITNVCNQIGTREENKIEWLPFNKNSLLKGEEITLGFFTDAKEGDYIEWIPTMYGNQRLYDYDVWNASLTNGLISYYELDETTGASANNEVGTEDGTLQQMENSDWTTGKINNGLLFGGTDEFFNRSNFYVNDMDFSVSLWFSSTTNTGYRSLASTIEGDVKGGFYIRLEDSDELIFLLYENTGNPASTLSSTSTFTTAVWHNVIITYNDGTGAMKLYIDGTLEDSSKSSESPSFSANTNGLRFGGSLQTYWYTGMEDEIGVWNRTLSQGEATQLYNTGSGISYGAPPTLPPLNITTTLISPETGFNTLNTTSINFNASAVPTSGNLTNITFYIWNSAHSIINQTTNTLVGNVTNYSNFLTIIVQMGVYNWNAYACAKNTTDTLCKFADSNKTILINQYSVNEESYNYTTRETARESFVLKLNVSTDGTSYSANFIYNNISKGSATRTGNDTYVIFSKTIDIPTRTSIGNSTFRFEINTGSATSDSTERSHLVNLTTFNICNATNTKSYLNITFKDEVTLTNINGSIPTSTFSFYLGSGTITKNLTYLNLSTLNPSYAFCSTPQDKTLYVSPYVQFKYGADYPQRTWSPSTQTYTNTTTNQTLYLLSSTDGIYVTYQVLNSAEQPIEGVDVTTTRTIEGSSVIIGAGTTDSAGLVTFWMNPDFSHTTTFTKSGYDTYTLSHFPTQTSYTITLGGISTTSITDYTRGISYSVKPTIGIYLQNRTMTNFNFTISSTYWTLQNFSFTLYGNGNLIGSNYSTSSSGGTISYYLNTSSNSSITMYPQWVINGSSVNLTFTWLIYDYSTGNNWSISNFFTDLKSYTSSGMFGLDDDSLNLIIFIFIVIVTGITSYKFGLTSPAVISGIVFVLILIFDVALGMITTPINAVPHFPTIFMVVVLTGFIIKEVTT